MAAASEALHVVGWSLHDIRHTLEINATPLVRDPLARPPGMRAWQPWPPQLAAKLFLEELNRLTVGANIGTASTQEAAYV